MCGDQNRERLRRRQGFLFARPLAAEAVERFLKEGTGLSGTKPAAQAAKTAVGERR